MKIITLTLNPAIDVHCYTKKFEPFCENLFKITSSDSGGKGINISRALTESKVKNTAIVVVGNENREGFLQGLKEENISYKEIVTSGRIRENITLHSEGQPETRISFSGFSADNTIIDEVRSILENEDLKDSIITFTGRVPDGIEIAYVKEFLIFLKKQGAKLVVDSRSLDKNDIKQIKPWLIKPNEEEIKLYVDMPAKDEKDAVIAAKHLKDQGIENVMISLGGRGAVLCCDDGVFFATTPKVEVVSTVGAGDSAIAGFIKAISEGTTYQEALLLAVSYGSAACLVEGTQAPNKEDIEKIYKNILIKVL